VVAVAVSDVEVLPAESVDELTELLVRCSTLAVENEQLWAEATRLRGENERLQGRVEKLEGQLEEARRAGKRQAAPFSRGEPETKPRRPGRRSGADHGRHSHRERPGEVDEELDAPLVARCECGGEVEHDRIEYQYRRSGPSRGRSAGGSRCTSASVAAAGAAIRGATRFRPRTRWGRRPACLVRGRSRSRRS
jgi:hypothetical protein